MSDREFEALPFHDHAPARVEDRRPVGLLFAVGGDVTFVNKIHHVLAALDIDLVT